MRCALWVTVCIVGWSLVGWNTKFKVQSSKFKVQMEKLVQPITERTFAFAVRIVKLCQTVGSTVGLASLWLTSVRVRHSDQIPW